jgi:hypothetical protein
LERSTPTDRRGHLSGDGDDGRAVQFGVIETGEQIGGAGTGDRKARGRPAGQLAVRARGERRRALVADADVGDLAALLCTTQRIGEAEVGVTHHPEHVRDAECHEGLDQDVADGADLRRHIGQLDENAVSAFLDRVARHSVAESGGRQTRDRVVVIAVPRAAQQTLLDRALAERATLVRTVIVQRTQPLATAGKRNGAPVHLDAADPTLGRDVALVHPVPS